MNVLAASEAKIGQAIPLKIIGGPQRPVGILIKIDALRSGVVSKCLSIVGGNNVTWGNGIDVYL
jgi:hypothetical protein